jgi:riboflavin biosynthesis pyrimidine reductase
MATLAEADRPCVVTLNSASADGRLAISSDVLLLYGDERWQAIDRASEFDVFEWLKTKHQPGATLEGSGSLVREGQVPDPLAPGAGDTSILHQDFVPQRVLDRPDHRGWFTVVDGRGRVRWGFKDGAAFGPSWEGWYLLVLVSRHSPPEYLAYLRREEIPYLVAGDEDHVDLGLALGKMRSRLGVECVLSTAGGRLNGALLRAGLVDEVNIVYLPAVVGGRNAPLLFDSTPLAPGEYPVQLDLVSCQVEAGGRVWVRYRALPPSP